MADRNDAETTPESPAARRIEANPAGEVSRLAAMVDATPRFPVVDFTSEGFRAAVPPAFERNTRTTRYGVRHSVRYPVPAADGDGSSEHRQHLVVWSLPVMPTTVQDVAEHVGDDDRFGLVEIRRLSDGRFLAIGERSDRHRLRVYTPGLVATCGSDPDYEDLNLEVCLSVERL